MNDHLLKRLANWASERATKTRRMRLNLLRDLDDLGEEIGGLHSRPAGRAPDLLAQPIVVPPGRKTGPA
jgi:hypothetical protein